MIAKLGTVNGYVKSTAWIGKRKFQFDGTVKGLVNSSIDNGAVVGTQIIANFGGSEKTGTREFELVCAKHDNRAKGFWVEQK